MALCFPEFRDFPAIDAIRKRTDLLFRQHGKGLDARLVEPTLRQSVEGIAKCQLVGEALADSRRKQLAMAADVDSKMGAGGRRARSDAEASMARSIGESLISETQGVQIDDKEAGCAEAHTPCCLPGRIRFQKFGWFS